MSPEPKENKNYNEVNDALSKYLLPARNMRRLLSGSPISKALLDLSSKDIGEWAHLVLLVYSDDFQASHPRLQGIVDQFRVLLLSPSLGTNFNLYSAFTANEASQAAEKMMRQELEEIRTLVKNQKDEIGRLHQLYHEKLLIEAPAQNWQNVLNERTRQWKIALGIFVGTIIITIILLLFYWTAISTMFINLTHTDKGISVTGLALITIPALLYAWMLRQVSRIYTRSFDLAVDAAHRKALAVTFLGLAENAKLGVTQTDRSIILQSLFRPQPPHVSDDGPPTGLLDLVRGKME